MPLNEKYGEDLKLTFEGAWIDKVLILNHLLQFIGRKWKNNQSNTCLEGKREKVNRYFFKIIQFCNKI